MNPLIRRFILLAIASLMLLAACGQDESDPPVAESTAVEPASQEEATEPEPPTTNNEHTTAYPEPERPAAETEPTVPSETAAEGYPAPQTAVDKPAPTTENADSYPAPESSSAETRTFIVVPDQSSASYVVSETFLAGAAERLGIDAGSVTTIGTTQDVNGQLTLAFGDTISLVSGEFEVDLSTLASDQNRRDSTIRDDFLESNTYPLATFVAKEIQNFPESYTEGSDVDFQLVGDLTIREETQEVTFEVTASLAGDTLTATAVTPLTMSDFGVEPPAFAGILSVEDDFQVSLDIVAIKQ